MKWKVLPRKSDDLIEQLLASRGVTTKGEKQKFFNPNLAGFEKDLQIPGIEKAKIRILEAIKSNEQIIVYGDFDVDGICGCAILYKALTSIGAKVLPYIPHREKEGYGLSKLGLEYSKDCGASVVITVDNGIVATEQARFAKEIGLDLIITDHHLPLDKKPEAFVIVHSTKMCGAAVAWCLIRNMISKNLTQELLQFVAIATICDLIPLVNLGRSFVAEGSKVLNTTTNLGLLALIHESGIRLGEIGSHEVGYIIGPRINAMGRLEHAIDSLRLLCTKDPQKAKKLARLLAETNAARQRLTADAMEQAKLLVNIEKKIHVLMHKDWPSGIIGLIAGKITEEYYRPAIVISLGEEVSKGSARSIDGINIVEVIRKHADILVDVGGHPGAAGFSILTKHVKLLKKKLEETVLDLPEEERVLEIDGEVEINQLTRHLLNELQKFEPFGFGNPRPVFATQGVQVSDIRTVGSGKHLKFKVVDPERSRGAGGIDTIGFGMGELINMLSDGQIVDIAYNLDIDKFNGTETLQLKVKDLRLA